jgi:hypothetical protein
VPVDAVQFDVEDSGDPGLPFDAGDIAAFGAGNEFERVVFGHPEVQMVTVRKATIG